MLLYGLKTCDTCRDAARALVKIGKAVDFIDVRVTPVDDRMLSAFTKMFPDRLLNRQSRTWRKLIESERYQPAESLLRAHPALMKRPLIVEGDEATLGWTAEVRAQWGVGHER